MPKLNFKSIMFYVTCHKNADRSANINSDQTASLAAVSYESKLLRSINPCYAEYIKMPCPLLIFSQSDYLIQIDDINSHT